MAKRHEHSVVLERYSDGFWNIARNEDGDALVLDNLTKRKIEWLQSILRSNYRWSSND